MRTIAVLMGALAIAGGGALVWQRSQVAEMRGEITALRESQERMTSVLLDPTVLNGEHPTGMAATPASMKSVRPSDALSATLREDERRLILSQYQDAVAQMNLPPEKAARLQGLLVERVESVLDAEDAAKREGFAQGSAEMSQAVVLAIGDVDREIANLVALASVRPAAPSYESPPVAAPVTVVVAPTIAPFYAPPEAQVAAPADTSVYPYAYSPLYPVVGYVVERPFGRGQVGAVQPQRSVGHGAVHPVRRRI